MNQQADSPTIESKKPLTFLMGKWLGFTLATMFLLYGGANLIFGILDRNYSDFVDSGMMLFYGFILITLAYAYRSQKIWGWYGLIAVNVIAALNLIFTFTDYIDGFLLLLFIAGIGTLLWPATKKEVLGQ